MYSRTRPGLCASTFGGIQERVELVWAAGCGTVGPDHGCVTHRSHRHAGMLGRRSGRRFPEGQLREGSRR